MKRIHPGRLCWRLLLCSIPACMLAVVWAPPSGFAFLREHVPSLYGFLEGVAPQFWSWPQCFAVQTLAAVAAVAGLVRWLKRGEDGSPKRGVRRFLLLLTVFGALAYLSYIWSEWRYSTVRTAIRLTPFLILCGVAALTCRRDEGRRTLAAVFAAAAVLQATLQAAIILWAAAGMESFSGWSDLQVAFRENQVFYANQNYSAAILLTAAYVIVALLVRSWRSGARRWPGVALRAVAACGGLVALGFIFLVNWSLQGRVAALVTVPAGLLWLLPPRKAVRVLIGLVFLGLIATGVVLESDRLRGELWRRALSPRSTAHLRTVYWMGAADMYARRPLAGWGMGTFPAVYPRFEPPIASGLRFTRQVRNTHPHNEFLAVGTALGTVGLCVYLALLVLAFGSSYRRLKGMSPDQQLLGFALWAGCLAFVVQSCFGRAPQNWTFATLFWILLGVLCAAGHREAPAADSRGRAAAMASWRWIPVIILGGLIAWAWWAWAVGGYRSMVSLRRAEELRTGLSRAENPPAAYVAYHRTVERARGRCPWPPLILYHDYVMGWFLTDHEQWERAERHLLQYVQGVAPEMLRTRILLARCAAGQGRPEEAREHLRAYIRRNPYELDGYHELARLDTVRAAELLSEHLRDVEGNLEPEKVRELLYYYMALGRPQAARSLVSRAEREGLAPPTVVQPLADWMASRPQERERLELLRQVFPDLVPDGGSAGDSPEEG